MNKYYNYYLNLKMMFNLIKITMTILLNKIIIDKYNNQNMNNQKNY